MCKITVKVKITDVQHCFLYIWRLKMMIKNIDTLNLVVLFDYFACLTIFAVIAARFALAMLLCIFIAQPATAFGYNLVFNSPTPLFLDVTASQGISEISRHSFKHANNATRVTSDEPTSQTLSRRWNNYQVRHESSTITFLIVSILVHWIIL